MTFIINGSGEREAESFDGTAAPQLIIQYSLESLSTENFEAENVIYIYPNPVDNWLKIKSEISINKINIFDINGKLIKAIKDNSDIQQVNVASFSKGLYFIEIINENKKSIKKFIKN